MKPHLLALVASALLGVTAPLVAPAQTLTPRVEQPAADFTDTELRSFVGAVTEVNRIGDAYLPRMMAATTREEQELLQENASTEMVFAVQNEGMTIAQFNAILTQVQSDPQLADRIRQHLVR